MKKLLVPMFALGAAFAMQPALASDGETLFKSKPCVACHTIDNKMVGPSLKEVAEKNAGVEGAVETLALHIKEGSAGIWGPIPMPPNVVTEEEATILAEWVLSLK
ncbi:MAG TPA: c-type cytochrome [Gammaproteobacteria bacterium]|nr:c-type cytochrome [Gammaproteobacteria bacterium]